MPSGNVLYAKKKRRLFVYHNFAYTPFKALVNLR